jgi:hypothetical protein
MSKLLVLLLGLGALSFAAYRVVSGGADAQGKPSTSAPKKQLDNVRKAATRIETEAQQRADQTVAP